MAIELHHLHPGHDGEVALLKQRIAELEKENAELIRRREKINKDKLNASDGSVKPYIEIDKSLIDAIAREYLAAKEKHPKFCDMLVDKQTDWNRLESIMKSRNDEFAPPYYAENILLEEVAEAMNAYQQRRLDDCLTELAQVGAVAMRCMSFVMAEKLKRGNHG